LATVTPAPAMTKAAVVEMLKVWAPSPPVPTMSMALGSEQGMGVAWARMTSAQAAMISGVSPVRRRAVMKAPSWAWVASPFMMRVMASVASVAVRVCSSISFLRIAFMLRTYCIGREVDTKKASGWTLLKACYDSCLGDLCFGTFDYFAEAFGIVNGDLGEDFAVEVDAGFVAAVDKAAV